MSDMDTVPAEAGTEDGAVLTAPTDQQIWDELLKERDKRPADDDEPGSDWNASHDSAGESEPEDSAAQAQAADTSQTQEPAARSPEEVETAGTEPAQAATEGDIEKQEHKVRSEKGRAAALERQGRYAEAAKVRSRISDLNEELAALQKSRQRLAESQKDTPDLQTLREEFPAVYQTMEVSLKSQDEDLAARQQAAAKKYETHVAEQTKLVKEEFPELDEFFKDEQTLQHLQDFLHPSNATQAQIQGFAENNKHFTNAASAIDSIKAFKEYLRSVQEPQETAQTGQTDSVAAPPPDQTGQAAAAAEATPSGVSTSPKTETNALQDQSRRQRQMEGAASTSSSHPAVSSSVPSEDASEEVLWEYWKRQREAKSK